jgi:hypothetical protein
MGRRSAGRGAALAAALGLWAAGASCGGRTRDPRAQLVTLFDLAPAAARDQFVAAGRSLPAGFEATRFVTPGHDGGDAELTAGMGFVDGLPATWVTTEIWLNFDEVWVQPLYRAMRNGVILDDPQIDEPWIFGIGPHSLFYSPFWEVYGFELPDGMDVTTVVDTRGVIEIANRVGGLRSLGRRITSLAPDNVSAGPAVQDAGYCDRTAAWDGLTRRRCIDFGAGGFDFDASDVVRETPFFVFAQREPTGAFRSRGFAGVAGTRPLFSEPPSLTGSPPGSSVVQPSLDERPSFGGLWRLYLVEPFSPTAAADGRVTDCLPSGVCLTLDSQATVEALGLDRIHRTEILAAMPLVQVGAVAVTDEAASAAAAR